jgi:transcriptional regulator with XRE-family HTH domain
MDEHKKALIRAITGKRLSEAANITSSRLSRILGGKSYLSAEVAHRLSESANLLCESLDLPSPFEANDFKPDLNNNYRELPLDALFIISDSLYSEDIEASAAKIIKHYKGEPEITQQLRELYLTADLDKTIELYDGRVVRIKETN